MIISVSGRINSGKDTVGHIIQYLTDKNVSGESFHYWYASNLYTVYNDNENWKIKKFADKLKNIVCLLINCTREQLEDRDFKEKELGEEWKLWRLKLPQGGSCYPLSKTKIFNSLEDCHEYYTSDNSVTGNIYKDSAFESFYLTPRLLLQLLGTECGRDIIHPNIWINSLMGEYGLTAYIESETKFGIKNSDWIITDTRFPNELKAIKDRGGISIRVDKYSVYSKTDTQFSKDIIHQSEIALDNAEFDYTIDNNGTIEELIEKVREILIKENIIK